MRYKMRRLILLARKRWRRETNQTREEGEGYRYSDRRSPCLYVRNVDTLHREGLLLGKFREVLRGRGQIMACKCGSSTVIKRKDKLVCFNCLVQDIVRKEIEGEGE
jgi:hypothetical protein